MIHPLPARVAVAGHEGFGLSHYASVNSLTASDGASCPASHKSRDVLAAAERKERARIRSGKGIRWGGRPLEAAARTRRTYASQRWPDGLTAGQTARDASIACVPFSIASSSRGEAIPLTEMISTSVMPTNASALRR